ncbi:uncharacterized protein CBL_08360 [Carabus blaptoides fortunei]
MARGSHKNKSGKRGFQGNTKKKQGSFQSKHSSGFKSKNTQTKKRKFNQNRNYNLHDDDAKRQKIELPVPEKQVSSSDSEEEVEDTLKQLLNTFDVNAATKKFTAIDSDESEESEEENNDEVSEEELSDETLDSNDENQNNEIEYDDIKSDKEDNKIVDNDDDEVPEEVIEENEIDIELLKEETETVLAAKDPFVAHLSYDLSDSLLDSLQSNINKTTHHIEWPELGKLLVTIPQSDEKKTKSNFTIAEDKIYAPLGKVPMRINHKRVDFCELNIKSQIHQHIKAANTEIDMDDEDEGPFTLMQSELFSIINNYQDLYFTERTFENGDEIRFVYALHAINHVLKTRTKVLHHNARLAKKDEVPEEFRDQGLVRPKVLIVVPFRDSALRIVRMLIDILVPEEKGQVINKNRFMDDFTGGELIMPKKNPKPEDYELTFTGNCDDTFKIGIQVTKKSLKLYADFYSSDIIIASPLGLRLTVGADGEHERDYDFLAAIELLILDQTELFKMQNWDHLVHVLDHLHMQPKDAHDTDFSRVRSWSLNGWSKYYRQTLIFAAFPLPEINAIFNKKCFNHTGSVRSVNAITSGAIMNVHVQVPQVYRKFEASSVVDSLNARFEFFISKILPQYKDSIMKQCLIYVPNYFDYVRIRNYFKREDISFVQICEYSKDGKIARARDMFYHGDAHFMLYSERFHYFRRIRVKGIRHIIFYQPPTFPHFYSEMCNIMQEANQNKKSGSLSNMTVTVIYSKYDAQQMSSVLGTDRLRRMATSSKNFHMFTSSDS